MDTPSSNIPPYISQRTTGRPRLDSRAFEMAARLRARRLQLRLTCLFVAQKLGVSQERYRAWEKQLGPTVENQYLHAIAQVIDVAPEWLSHGTGPNPLSPDGSMFMQVLPPDNPGIQTDQELVALGQRARTRRTDLQLKRPEVAKQIGMSPHLLLGWERKLPRKSKNDVERRWEEVLRVPEGWLRNPSLVAPTTLPSSIIQTVEVVAATNVAAEIRAAGAWLCRASPSRRSAEYRQLSAAEQRLADIFSLRYGVDGEENITLQVIGDRYGLTRERIRQIVQKMVDRSAKLRLKTEHLDKLPDIIRPILPAPVDVVDIKAREILGESLSIASVDRFCREILGRNLVALTDKPADMTHSWPLTVIDPLTHDMDRIRAVREAALRMIRSCGAAQALFVAGAAGEILGRGVLPAEAIQDCQMVPGFEWLMEKDGWFWFGEVPENRLISIAIKILVSAGQRVDSEEIVAGFARSRRVHYEPGRQRPYMLEPPQQVVVEILRRVQGVQNVQHDDFLLTNRIPIEAVLSDAEQAVHSLMRSNGNIVSRHMLNMQLVETGKVKFMALQVSLDNSPIYRQLDRGVFALRGSALSAQALRAALETVGRGKSKSARVSERDSEGFYHITTEFTEYMARTRVWDIPSSLSQVLEEGDYFLQGFEEAVTFARLPSGSNRLKRFVAKLVQMGCKPGDSIDLAINPSTRMIYAARVA